MESMFRLRDDHILRRLDVAGRELRDRRAAGEGFGTPASHDQLSRQLTRTEARIRDVSSVFQRLRGDALQPKRSTPSSEPSEEVGLDNETFRHFAVMLLDEWARTAAYLSGVDRPQNFDFSALVAAVDSDSLPPALSPVRDGLFRHVRWLHFWLFIYRNDRVDAELARAQHRSNPAENDNIGFDENWAPNRARSLLTRVVENIMNLDRRIDRERIASLAAEAALRAPSVQVVASVVADFMSRSVSYVLEGAFERSNTIDLSAVRAARASSGTGPTGVP
jgi:hypothetical protein